MSGNFALYLEGWSHSGLLGDDDQQVIMYPSEKVRTSALFSISVPYSKRIMAVWFLGDHYHRAMEKYRANRELS